MAALGPPGGPGGVVAAGRPGRAVWTGTVSSCSSMVRAAFASKKPWPPWFNGVHLLYFLPVGIFNSYWNWPFGSLEYFFLGTFIASSMKMRGLGWAFFSEETRLFFFEKFNNYQWFEAAVNRNVVICFAVSFCISPALALCHRKILQRFCQMTG